MKNRQMKKHLMTAVSYLIPFVASAGMLMVVGNLFGGTSQEVLSSSMSLPDLLTTLGGTALGFIPVIISAGISYSIASKAGIAPGVILGLLCKVDGYGSPPSTTADPSTRWSSPLPWACSPRVWAAPSPTSSRLR